MIDAMEFTRDIFIACDWKYEVLPDNHHGYSSVMRHLQKSAREKLEAGNTGQSKVLDLLGCAASMMLAPSSLNEPFSAYVQDFQAGRRSTLPEDFTPEELSFFEDILSDTNEPWLKARLADLLWLLKRPRNPDHAKIAIESYTSHAINSDTWRRDVDDCWERAARLCIQIKDFDKLNEIKNQLLSAFLSDYPKCKFMHLWLASLLNKLKIDQDAYVDIASTLHRKAEELKSDGDFLAARSYLDLAERKYQQCADDKGRIVSLILIADCFEMEADSRSGASNIVANSLYENAVQAYRRIPAKYRNDYGVEDKIAIIRGKIAKSGQASLDEMALVKTQGMDISEIVKSSVAHVEGKQSPEEALVYFSGLYSGPDYEKLSSSAKESMKQGFFSTFFSSAHMSSDGRVVAKTPSVNLDAGEDDPINKVVLHGKIQQHFSIDVQLVVEGQILPALNQLLKDHRFTRDLMIDICHQSPIVPKDRETLLGHALWMGFEHDFGVAIHLLCPQVEHIVRTLLKDAGAHTSNIDKDGIENENGLSTLMELEEVDKIFGPDLAFEIKSVFTESLGFNLRNEVAHGLLNDNSSSSIPTIYAWWMVIRLMIRSIMYGEIKSENHVVLE